MRNPNPNYHPLKVPPPGRRKCGRFKCIAITASIFVIVLIALAVIGYTVIRPKQAIITVDSVDLDGLDVGFDVLDFGIRLNATVALNISVTNPNRAGFEYENGTAHLYYQSVLVGEAVIPKGDIGPGETVKTFFRLTILADKIVTIGKLYSEVMEGKLSMFTATTIPGKVVIMWFKYPMLVLSSCDLTIGFADRTVQKSNCLSETKF